MNDIIGQIFGSWIVLELLDELCINNRRMYKCICECGFIAKKRREHLINQVVRKCERCSMWNRKSEELKKYLGMKIGKRIILHFAEKDTSENSILVETQCQCGQINEIKLKNLINNKSLGCNDCAKEAKIKVLKANPYKGKKSVLKQV